MRKSSVATDPAAAPDLVDVVSIYVSRRGMRYEGSVRLHQYTSFASFPVRHLDGTSSIRTVGLADRHLVSVPLEYAPGVRPTTSGVLRALARELMRAAEGLAGNPSPSALEGQAELF